MIYLETEKEFTELIKKELVLVDFYAEWCGPCKLIGKEIESLDKETKEIEIVKVDIDKFPELATKYSIMAVPTLKVYQNGKEINNHSGYLTKDEIKSLLM